MKFDFSGGGALKRRVFSRRDWHELLSHLESPHVLTVIYQQRTDDMQGAAELSFVSDSAMRFYGYDHRRALIGKKADDLIKILTPWLANRAAFEADQKRVIKQLEEGMIAVAEEPMIINDKHPSPEFRAKRYHPVIAHWATDSHKNGVNDDFMTVLYLDLSGRPGKTAPRLQSKAA